MVSGVQDSVNLVYLVFHCAHGCHELLSGRGAPVFLETQYFRDFRVLLEDPVVLVDLGGLEFLNYLVVLVYLDALYDPVCPVCLVLLVGLVVLEAQISHGDLVCLVSLGVHLFPVHLGIPDLHVGLVDLVGPVVLVDKYILAKGFDKSKFVLGFPNHSRGVLPAKRPLSKYLKKRLLFLFLNINTYF